MMASRVQGVLRGLSLRMRGRSAGWLRRMWPARSPQTAVVTSRGFSDDSKIGRIFGAEVSDDEVMEREYELASQLETDLDDLGVVPQTTEIPEYLQNRPGGGMFPSEHVFYDAIQGRHFTMDTLGKRVYFDTPQEVSHRPFYVQELERAETSASDAEERGFDSDLEFDFEAPTDHVPTPEELAAAFADDGGGDDDDALEEVPTPDIDKFGRAFAKGRRKRARAEVYIARGTGVCWVNQMRHWVYFHSYRERYNFLAPFVAANCIGRFDVFCKVWGGGKTGQASACQLAIARALVKFNPRYKRMLRVSGMLRVDIRKKERKHPGFVKARKGWPFVKR